MDYQSAIDQAVVDGKLSDSARQNIKQWLTGKKYAEYLDELQQLITKKAWQTLDDNFWQIVPFGTGGRRGTVGAQHRKADIHCAQV